VSLRRAIAVGAGLIGIILTIASYAPNAYTKTVTTSGDSSNKETALSFNAAECENGRLNSKTMRLLGSFEVTEIGEYQNVFQTSNINEGVRLEIDKEGRTALIIGLGDGIDHTGIRFKNTVETGVRYQFRFEIRESKSVFYSFLSEEGVRDFDAIQPLCGRVLVGGGYDQSRSLRGRAQLEFNVEKNGLIGLQAHRVRTSGAICLYFFGLTIINRRRDSRQCQR
jgi:hypothetical protein